MVKSLNHKTYEMGNGRRRNMKDCGYLLIISINLYTIYLSRLLMIYKHKTEYNNFQETIKIHV